MTKSFKRFCISYHQALSGIESRIIFNCDVKHNNETSSLWFYLPALRFFTEVEIDSFIVYKSDIQKLFQFLSDW